MASETSQVLVNRVFEAPRALVWRAFTDPDHLAMWWGPIGNSLPRDQIQFDIRPGGFQKWVEVVAADPDTRLNIYVDLTDVANEEVLEGVMHVSGQRHDGFEAFETKFRVDFYDEPDGRTRLEIQQWLPPHLIGPSKQGWLEAFTKLDVALTQAPGVPAKQSGGIA